MSGGVVVLAIRAYRAWLSPWKGFRCAWAAGTGRGSCSDVGLTVFRRAGLRRGLALMRRQFDRCTIAADALRQLQPPPQQRRRPQAAQRGDCDIGICDAPGNCGDHWGCDVAECISEAPCECGDRRDNAAEAARKRAEQRRARREARRRAAAR